MPNTNNLVTDIMNRERSIIKDTNVKYALLASMDGGKLVNFAEIFHFVRYDFCRLNFILGSRCCNNERLWGGLVRNLMEELGGKRGLSHNQLYRDFLQAIGARPEEKLECPKFAHNFNNTWESFTRQAPLMEALSAIAIYEIFDVPDYQMFLEILERAEVPEEGLVFFRVHANAHHFEMFEDTVTWILQQEGGQEAFDRAKDFVFETQQQMWLGLIECLEKDGADSLDLDLLAPIS